MKSDWDHQRKEEVILLAVGDELGQTGTEGCDGGGEFLIELGRVGENINFYIIEEKIATRTFGDFVHIDVVFLGARFATIGFGKTNLVGGFTRFFTKGTKRSIEKQWGAGTECLRRSSARSGWCGGNHSTILTEGRIVMGGASVERRIGTIGRTGGINTMNGRGRTRQ